MSESLQVIAEKPLVGKRWFYFLSEDGTTWEGQMGGVVINGLYIRILGKLQLGVESLVGASVVITHILETGETTISKI